MSFPAFVGDRAAGAGSVTLQTNRTNPRIETGEDLPPIIQTEKSSSVTVLIDSNDKYTGTEANFRVNLGFRVVRPRYIQLKKVIVPKIPNVTANNNTIRLITAQGNTAFFTLAPGIYNTTTLANELTTKINAAFTAAAIIDSVSTSYDPTTRTFTITTVGGTFWFFDSTSTFISYGRYLCGFSGYPAATIPTVSTQYSGIAGMLYTRYLTVASESLTSYSYSSSILSRANQPNDLIGIIDLADLYSAADFDISIPFSGVYKTLQVDGPQLSLLCSQRSMNEDIDIRVSDGYGLFLDSALNLGAPYGSNTLAIILIFDLQF